MKNDYGPLTVLMFPAVHCFCDLGYQWYNAELTISMKLGDELPDYCEVQKYITENVNGKHLIVEKMVEKVFNYLETYRPLALAVEAEVGAGEHFPVIIRKERLDD